MTAEYFEASYNREKLIGLCIYKYGIQSKAFCVSPI